MSRKDLLMLSVEDLIILSNRGIVKRAQQEAESDTLQCTIEVDATGNVAARWSDDVTCELPIDSSLANSRCSCPATTLCRHLVRTVFAYQRWQASQQAIPSSNGGESAELSSRSATISPTLSPASPVSPSEGERDTAEATQDAIQSTTVTPTPPPTPNTTPWNPGDIEDVTLERVFSKKTLVQARKQFDEGQTLELLRTARPTVRNHSHGTHLRFLIPGDPRYTHCDCPEPAPCSHVPIAVWAFRLLPSEQHAGIVSTRSAPLPVPIALLDDIEQTFAELAHHGFANLPATVLAHLHRHEEGCRNAGLIWPAEIIAELLSLHDSYTRHDARFSALSLAERVAELYIRMDGIRNDTGATPQLFVRGSKADRHSEIGSARLVGLGCGVEVHRTGVHLCSYMQDTNTGAVVVVRRNYTNPVEEKAEEALPFWQLAQGPVARGINLATLGSGQLLVQGGKRSPNHEFIFGRAAINSNPQSYQWESLRPPTLSESFTEVAARLSTLPPPPLRPRRLTEDVFICPVERISDPRFVTFSQSVETTLQDSSGATATLQHPYTSRGASGSESLLEALLACTERPAECAVRFVAGHMRLRGGELVIEPISLVLESRGARLLLQPWIERRFQFQVPFQSPSSNLSTISSDTISSDTISSDTISSDTISPDTISSDTSSSDTISSENSIEGNGDSTQNFSAKIEETMNGLPNLSANPVVFCHSPLLENIGELLLMGLNRADKAQVRRWQDNLRNAEGMGFVRLVHPLRQLVAGLEARQSDLRWDSRPTYQALTELAVATLLMQTL